MPNDSNDMSIDVTVTVSGSYDLSSNPPPTISAAYSGSTTPSPIAGQSVILPNGNINLNQLNKSSGNYSNATKIKFSLAGSVTSVSDPSGNPIYPEFPSDGDSVSIVPANMTPFRGSGVPTNWAQNKDDSTDVTITDPDTDGANYNYALYVVLNGVTCPIDPSIMNRRV